MKKIFLYIALLATACCAQAQYDTLNIGDRDPTFYYWDTNWWDHYYLNYPQARADSIEWSGGIGVFGLQPEFARYCYTDTALRIIGIAATLRIDPANFAIYDTLLPDYLCLYEVDNTTDEMVLLAKKTWQGTRPRYQMAYAETNQYTLTPDTMIKIPPEYAPVFEVYFDSAITVRDSFYVSSTNYNNKRPYSQPHTAPLAAVHAWSTGEMVNGSYVHQYPQFYPKPNHYRRRLHEMPIYDWEDTRFNIQDTAWHTFSLFKSKTPNTVDEGADWSYFMFIFPIIDTTGLYLRQPCNTTTGFRNVSIDSCTVAMEWNPDGSSERYEVAVSRIGRTPEEGTVVQSDTNYAVVRTEPWDTTAQWYSAWVRCICAAGHRSEWSSPVTFNVHCSPGAGPEDPVGISVAVDRASRLQPNPASGSVRVESSYRIAEVELFSLDGRSLQRRAVDATGTTLDISQLPSGTYIVRIATTSGTAYKKLVVK